jgi:hypothetical protein
MVSEELNRMTFERDLALRQAKLSKADLEVIQMALNENRPLEALRTVNQSIERLDEELDAIEEFPNDSATDPNEEEPKEGARKENVDTRDIVDDWLWEQYGFGIEHLEEEHVEGVSPEPGEGVNDAG